jgi:hypothetical protein
MLMRHIIFTALLVGGAVAILPWLASHGSLSAQQFIVDDAGTVGAGACQVEGWVGQRNSWLLPACQLSRWPEVTVGVGGQARDGGGRDAAWVLQAKLPLRDPDEHAWGWGVVAGLGGDPLAQVTGRRPESVFAYIPLSVPSPAGLLHLNLGWYWERDDDPSISPTHHLAWGVRLDRELTPRLLLIGELASEGRARPEWQGGLRLVVAPEALLLDLSVGASLEPGRSGGGLALGAAWTPQPLR